MSGKTYNDGVWVVGKDESGVLLGKLVVPVLRESACTWAKEAVMDKPSSGSLGSSFGEVLCGSLA